MSVDLVLLHAPSVYDFRQKTILYGPVSDLIPPSPVFEMYPVGLASLSSYLERHGYRVRIVNLAYRMLKSSQFDPEGMIRKMAAPLFGLDLHWLAHAQGSAVKLIETSRLLRGKRTRVGRM